MRLTYLLCRRCDTNRYSYLLTYYLKILSKYEVHVLLVNMLPAAPAVGQKLFAR